MASSSSDSRTSASYSVTWQRILSNINRTPRTAASIILRLCFQFSERTKPLNHLGTSYSTRTSFVIVAKT
jgi:hypothetical protein